MSYGRSIIAASGARRIAARIGAKSSPRLLAASASRSPCIRATLTAHGSCPRCAIACAFRSMANSLSPAPRTVAPPSPSCAMDYQPSRPMTLYIATAWPLPTTATHWRWHRPAVACGCRTMVANTGARIQRVCRRSTRFGLPASEAGAVLSHRPSEVHRIDWPPADGAHESSQALGPTGFAVPKLQRPLQHAREFAHHAAAKRQHANDENHALHDRDPGAELGQVVFHRDDDRGADDRAEDRAEAADQGHQDHFAGH